MIDSVDKLREACKGHMYTGCDDIPHLICDAFGIGHRPYNWGSVLIPVCDAIEAEIEHDYMRLPVDADGVPIRVGDKLNYTDPFGNVFLCTVQPLLSHNPKCYRHVKPRTLEDVLFEFGEEFEGEMDEITPIIAKYAEEIRVMFGEVER